MWSGVECCGVEWGPGVTVRVGDPVGQPPVTHILRRWEMTHTTSVYTYMYMYKGTESKLVQKVFHCTYSRYMHAHVFSTCTYM